MSNLPTGTVTFLFTDIEASVKRWETHPILMAGERGITARATRMPMILMFTKLLPESTLLFTPAPYSNSNVISWRSTSKMRSFVALGRRAAR